MGTAQIPSGAAPLDSASRVEAQVAELERAIQGFEDTAAQVERCLDKVERLEADGGARDESSLQPLKQALRASRQKAAQVDAASRALDEALEQAEAVAQSDSVERTEPGEIDLAPLPVGTLICDGRYRLLQLLSARPRVHLYLARRLLNLPGTMPVAPMLVAIRELVLDGLDTEIRRQVVRAAFEEFAAPQLFGSPHLPGVGDHLYVEEGRHYLVMQPRPARSRSLAFAQPLSEILPGQTRGSAWPNLPTALSLAVRLCQTVVRLHRTRTLLGELTPEMVLVDRVGSSSWSPLLLASWPPAPSFWPDAIDAGKSEEIARLHAQAFPLVEQTEPGASRERPFAAPEIFEGRCDERSDVYTLGAFLYLLLTGSTPASASSRLQAARAQSARDTRGERLTPRRGRKTSRTEQKEPQSAQAPALTPPRQLNARISPLLEQILLRALDLDPQQRFASAQDLAESLESMHLKGEMPGPPAPLTQARVSRLRRLLEWLKR